MYILADLGAEVVFHLGVTTSYALTEFVVYWRLNFLRRDNFTINKPCVYYQTNKKQVEGRRMMDYG